MRAIALSVVLLTLLSITALAAVAGTEPVDPVPAAGATPAAPYGAPIIGAFQLAPLPMFDVGSASTCNATATCADGRTISCSCNDTACSCSGVDQNCSTGVEGSVSCGSTRVYCDTCCWAPRSKCISGLQCQQECGNCGPLGNCIDGSCYCEPLVP